MSSVSSPVHRFSGDFDGMFYDQNFTADISNRMRVPTKILVTGENKHSVNEFLSSASITTNPENEFTVKVGGMQVPDRIVVAGNEVHMGIKAPPRELRLEQRIAPDPPPSIRVQTPPRVITMEDHYFPTVGDEPEVVENDKNSTENPSRGNPMEVSLMDHNTTTGPLTPPGALYENALSPTEELVVLRRHLIKLNRRITLLETESQLRQQREMITYSLGVAYFVLKAILWLHRNW